MNLIKIQEKNYEITSNLFEGIMIYEDLSRPEFLKKMAIKTENIQYEAGIFYGDRLIKNNVKKFLYNLSEIFNIPFFYYDKDVSLEEQIANASEEFQWKLTYFNYPKGKEEYSIESLLTVGNGYLGLRGTTPEMECSDSNYPGIYMAGVYNSLNSNINGKSVVNEDFVNLPNSQIIYLLVDGEKINIEDNQIDCLYRELDLRTGELISYAEITLRNGHHLKIETKKIVSMAKKNFYGISYKFQLDYSAENVKVYSEINGDVKNYNVERYRDLANKHLTIIEMEEQQSNVSMIAETKKSKIKLYQSSNLFSDDFSLDTIKNVIDDKTIEQVISIKPEEQTWYGIEKIVYVAKETTDNDVLHPRYDELFLSSKKEWEKLWNKASINISGDLMSQKMLNLHTYHMLVSASPNGNLRSDASITARGLHGEAYRGHIFWDELFMMPFYLIHFPDTVKQLLMYRYQRLDKAKELAKEAGYEGAMFPWQSGLDGSEQSQKIHLNPLSGEWKEDHSRRQRHVSLAIAYNYWMYFQYTRDYDFLESYGLEMLTEISKFWLSIAEYDMDLERFVIKCVMGPDEFHEAYPNEKKGGLNNNAYTNLMVVWLFGVIEEIVDKYKFEVNLDMDKLREVKKTIFLEINDEGIIAQFQGYFQLKEIDWNYYKNKYTNIYRMDRILNAEGKSADEFKVAKQADSLMIFYNFPTKMVQKLIESLNYKVPQNFVQLNLDYYLKRTSHGSTLSRVVHSQLAEIVGNRELSWKLYQEALYSDYRDIQGGTTAEGIHTGVMASTLAITLSDFAGLDIREEMIAIEPHLPKKWKNLSFHFTKQSVMYDVAISKESIEIEVNQETTILLNQKETLLMPNIVNKFNY